jgi:hypothetical protein
MEKINISFNADRVVVNDTFDLVELARSPIYAIMLLKAEHTLFNGSKNKSREFSTLITKGFLKDPEVLRSFLEKTLGEKNLEKQKALFKLFKKSLNSSYNESRYFGNILFDDPVSTDLKAYLEDPTNKNNELTFLTSLTMIFQESEENLKNRRVIANRHLAAVLEKVHSHG